MERKGLVAEDWRLRVTQEPKIFERFGILPCQAGWKQQDGTWENEWITVKVFEPAMIQGIAKGDTVMVDGRVVKERRGEYLNWVVLADAVRAQNRSPQPAREPARAQYPASSEDMDQMPDDDGVPF